jgi:hypothetical protein
MPCACRLPYETYPDAGVWGPILWSILHGIAERVGSATFALYQADERRALNSLFKAVAKMIPCPSCKEHYEVYLKEHPVDGPLKELSYSTLRVYVRRWFWELHNWVNYSKGVPEFPLEDVPALYSRVPIREKLKELREPMERAIRISGNQILGYQELQKHISTLLSIYGL